MFLSPGDKSQLSWTGKRDEALKVIAEMKQRPNVSSMGLANIYTALGEKEQAFEWLEKAYAEGAPILRSLQTGKTWDPLRSDPRFKDRMCLDKGSSPLTFGVPYGSRTPARRGRRLEREGNHCQRNLAAWIALYPHLKDSGERLLDVNGRANEMPVRRNHESVRRQPEHVS
jgi:hypothetical protein